LYANKNDVFSLLEMHVEIASASIQVGGGGERAKKQRGRSG